MRQYETGFLISPNLSEEETENIILQMADIVSQKKGKMIEQEKWGKRKLAYNIEKFSEAFYVFFHYEGSPEIPLELARRFKQMDTILRYLTLKKEGDGNVRRRKKIEPEAEKEKQVLGGEHTGDVDLTKEKLISEKAGEEE